MTTQLTFYLSQVLGKKFYFSDTDDKGIIKDVLINSSLERPKITGVKVKIKGDFKYLDFSGFEIIREGRRFTIICNKITEIKLDDNILLLGEKILDKQIVDLNGRKLVRVNDVRLVLIPSGTYSLAVDVGLEGLLRRIGIVKPIQLLLSLFKTNVPSQFILWEDVETVNISKSNIKLTKAYSKLHTLHPSDIADIIEDLDKATRTTIFASLDDEKAADVLEELETHAQVHIIESLSTEKAADVLEKMPADEAADILDELEEEKVEELLSEMDLETSEDVRDLLEYSDKSVGSIMSTDYLYFNENNTVEETIKELRRLKPETDTIYSLLVLDKYEKLIATVSLRDMIISEPDKKLSEIMNRDFISVYDDDKIDTLAEIISKYDLLAIPVTDKNMKIEGMVVIDDIVEDLMKDRKTK